MSEQPDPIPPKGIDLERPNAARMYDWFLGGSANWAIDRQAGELAVAAVPDLKTYARLNREFLARAVRFCVRAGVTQFLDIGSGVPTVGNVHEVAEELDPASRCVYVDNEPVAVAHSEVLLDENGDPARHAIVESDLRDVEGTWRRAVETGVIDPGRPIGLIMVAVLHFVPPEDGGDDAVAGYRDLLPSGSRLVLSHATTDGVPADQIEGAERVRAIYQNSSTPVCWRTRDQFTSLFGDFELAPPGVEWVPAWRPDPPRTALDRELAKAPNRAGILGAVGRKP
ncbi:SAM-dependent methyltransferase [Amycolatopsis suaedae]|uniref:Methyltransferase n=1 Tax=Amycolatopsis suaedae TaxID=2510978 RepID=A0A4Q7JAU0_9PSEU|nr:SAM-dependent methyltransferase [Amycolatopsis suaedae]RZQ64387.1 methyltransferase [Amycolatopsis suaedae]